MPWLMKAEPDSRIVKGKDVKFSIDDFEALGESQWDGVRSHEAKKIMKEKMKLGDKVLFYHSNTKIPGVYGLAEVSKEGYPDYTAFDESHPYYDPKSSKENPTWFMVSVKFISRLEYPPTLAIIKHLSTLSTLPSEIDYIGEGGLKALSAMQLINRGRLSVQPVTEEAYKAVVKLGTKGGWDGLPPAKGKVGKAGSVKVEDGDEAIKEEKGKRGKAQGKKSKAKKVDDEVEGSDADDVKLVKEEVVPEKEGGRRSKRLKK